MTTGIRFVLDGEVHSPGPIEPTLTVLRYLREHLGRCGSKEGCAEGDCGACTVVIGELRDGALRYRAVNSCIQFLPTLDGKQLITIENLKDEHGELHPVQQAMVDHHASQCGFCTPGLVMSMFSMYHQNEQPSQLQINDALAGNLCRCTGYGPIIEATANACQQRADDSFDRQSEVTRKQLAAIRRDHTLVLEVEGARYFAPQDLDETLELMQSHPQAVLLAGATDMGLWVTKQHRKLEMIIDLGRVAALQQLLETDDYLEIGAGVTYTDALPVISRHFPDFGEMMRRIGALQVRNMGTIGGNIANGSPIGDMPPPLIAAGAILVLRGPGGRREIPLESFFLEYGKQDLAAGELVEWIRLPLPQPGSVHACYKISKRFDQDISSVCAAFSMSRDEAGKVAAFRAAFGGMAATPKRATELESALLGQDWNAATIERVIPLLARDFTPISDMRASAGYRLEVAGNLLRKFWIESEPGSPSTRLFGSREHSYGRR
jgi:xanthine dehydrogenase small subunit